MPEIEGNIYNIAHGAQVYGSANGAFLRLKASDYGNANEAGPLNNFNFKASRYNGIYGASQTVQPPALALIPQIRF